MAEIKIKHTDTAGDYSKETIVEVSGLEYGADELTKTIMDGLGLTENVLESGASYIESAYDPQQNSPTDKSFKMRRIENLCISTAGLKSAIEGKRLDLLVPAFTEIDIPLGTGETITVVCGYSDKNTARFVFKDCYDEAVMNNEPTNKGGYYKSEGRKHVLEDIYPHLPQEWKDIIKPRKLAEIIDGEKVEYSDPLWLPSATDVFGASEDGYWKDVDDSFQLPIFQKERDRVKEVEDVGTCHWWLRSVNATTTSSFRVVITGGYSNTYYAYYSIGFAPGFDI